jgi:uncharacterized protein YlxW (UPF0749 family)
MTDDRSKGRPGSPGTDDDAAPHPFGPGRLGEQGPASPDAGTDPADQPAEPDAAAEPEASAEPDGEGETEEPAEPVVEEPTDVESAAGSAAVDAGQPKVTVTARRRRDPLAAALIGVLTLLLGFAFAVQVRNVGNDPQLAGAREEDLVRILDDLNAREERLRQQISDQRAALQQLSSSDSQSAAALEEARKRAEAIGILNGTIAAQGPGFTMTVRDTDDAVRVADVLDAIQELRGAGAETMQIDGVRVGVSTAVTGDPGSLMIDGRPITAPYEFVVIGDPQSMETAMNIPGGVVPRFTSRGASAAINPSDEVVVDALRPLDTPQYASPTGN